MPADLLVQHDADAHLAHRRLEGLVVDLAVALGGMRIAREQLSRGCQTGMYRIEPSVRSRRSMLPAYWPGGTELTTPPWAGAVATVPWNGAIGTVMPGRNSALIVARSRFR